MTTTEEILGQCIGKRVIVRTRVSGVSLGTLNAVSDDGTAVHLTGVEPDDEPVEGLTGAWRIWGWSGSAFTLSEIARDGAGVLRVDQHPDTGIRMTDTAGIEILQVAPKIEKKLRQNWQPGCQ